MMDNTGLVGLSARIAATFATNTYFGAVIYTNMVEVPARLELKTSSAMVNHFQASFPRAMQFAGSLAAVSIVCSGVGWYLDEDPNSYLFLTSFLLMFSLFPWTKVALMPINKQLMDGDTPAKKGDSWVVEMLNKWNMMHFVRSSISCVAMCAIGFYWINRAETLLDIVG